MQPALRESKAKLDGEEQSVEGKFAGVYDTATPVGSPRPGVVRFQLDGKEVAVRFPEYESGHEVTFGTAREFGEDLAEWLVDTGATGHTE